MRAAAAAGLEGDAGRSGVEYLVSWKELPLDQASWEAAEVRGTGWLLPSLEALCFCGSVHGGGQDTMAFQARTNQLRRYALACFGTVS